MKKTYFLVLLVSSLFNFSCTNLTKGNKIENEQLVIEPRKDYSYKECASKYKGFYNRFGLSISNYYEVVDYLGIGNDSVAILSPILLTPTASECRDDKMEIINNRLLVANLDVKTKVYGNVITNKIGMGTSGSEFIKNSKNGFTLYNSIGQSCKVSYSINVVIFDKNLYVDEIFVENLCRKNNMQKKVIKFNNYEFPLSKFRREMIDSLSNDLK